MGGAAADGSTRRVWDQEQMLTEDILTGLHATLMPHGVKCRGAART
jgi:hypothetical protein